MSKEAMKLALDHSEPSILSPGWTLVRNEDIAALREALADQPAQQKPVNLRRGDLLRCIETDELCTVWATSPTGNTLIKWSANNFGNYTAEQIGELFWLEPAQQEPEYIVQSNGSVSPLLTHMMNKRVKSNVKQVIELYDSPEQPAQQEPVAWVEGVEIYWRNAPDLNDWIRQNGQPLYTSPPAQRTWVGLTNDEINNLVAGCHLGNSVQDAIYKAEAKLRSKNT